MKKIIKNILDNTNIVILLVTHDDKLLSDMVYETIIL